MSAECGMNISLICSKRGKEFIDVLSHQVPFLETGRSFCASTTTRLELFFFLATSVTDIDTAKQIICTHHAEVLCTQPRDISGLAPCTHEEADTLIFLHLEDAVKEQYTKVSLRTIDTDVLVLAVTAG